jgi:tetratricopeptide (TPR) repeat protein
MTIRIFKQDYFFFSALFLCWMGWVLVGYKPVPFNGQPLPSANLERHPGSALGQHVKGEQDIAKLKTSLVSEKDSSARMEIFNAIGSAYFDLERENGNRILFDSVYKFYTLSVLGAPTVARYHYNLGRFYTDIASHEKAKAEYEATIALDPMHVFALNNLGMACYFELKQPVAACQYLSRALAIDSMLFTCNLALGLAEIDVKAYSSAREHFEREIALDQSYSKRSQQYPTSAGNVRYAEALAHSNLALLYSTQFPDQQKAQMHFHAYLQIEQDPQKREDLTQQMKKYWVMK